MRKALIACFALTVVALAVVAVAPSSTSSAAALPGCAKDSLNLVQDGTLTIGADNPAFPPWYGGDENKKTKFKLTDPTSGQGYESAVAYGIARRLGFGKNAVTWTPVPFNNSFKPGKKPFDIYLTQVSIKPERRKAVTFSAPYYTVEQSVVALKTSPLAKVRSVAGLRKYKFGAQVGTTSYETITKVIKPSQTPAVYDQNIDAVNALKNKQIDGLVVDFPTGAGYLTAVQVPEARVIGRIASTKPEFFGAVLQKGNPLVACVNKAIAQMRADGSLKRLEAKWLSKFASAPRLK